MSEKRSKKGNIDVKDLFDPETLTQKFEKDIVKLRERLRTMEVQHIDSLRRYFKGSMRKSMKVHKKIDAKGAPSLEALSMYCRLTEILMTQPDQSLTDIAQTHFGLTMPNLSKRLIHLEMWMNAERKKPIKFIHRTAGSSRHSLTLEGIAFYKKAIAMLSIYDSF